MQNSFQMSQLNGQIDFKNMTEGYIIPDEFSMDEDSLDEDSDPNIFPHIKHQVIQNGNASIINSQVIHSKKTPPPKGKKTKGRVKIKMEFIDNKLRRYTTFSKRKTGIMKKAYELSTLTGTQVMLLVASETGHVYTFATRKLQPMITSETGKSLIQTCLNSPDPPSSGPPDQRMSATGFEETELSYGVMEEENKVLDQTQQRQYIAVSTSSASTSGETQLLTTSGKVVTQAPTLAPRFTAVIDGSILNSLQAQSQMSSGQPVFKLALPGSSGNAANGSSPPSSSSPTLASQLISNVVLPNGNGTIMYQTPQGLVYTTGNGGGESVLLKFQQDQPLITIPYALSQDHSKLLQQTTQLIAPQPNKSSQQQHHQPARMKISRLKK